MALIGLGRFVGNFFLYRIMIKFLLWDLFRNRNNPSHSEPITGTLQRLHLSHRSFASVEVVTSHPRERMVGSLLAVAIQVAVAAAPNSQSPVRLPTLRCPP
jgi:hypothetical protein